MRKTMVVVVGTMSLIAACSGGSGSDAPSSQGGGDGGWGPSQPLSELSPSQQAALCDSLYAGDPGSLQCPVDGGTITVHPSPVWSTQATCVKAVSILSS